MQPIVKTSSSLPTVLHSHRWLLPNEQATEAWAQTLAQSPQVKQLTMALQGTLGAGKTTLTRYLLRALGVTGRIKSPSYAIVEPYTLACASAAWHFDFYRFSDPREWEDAGFRDVFASPGLKIVEWWQNAQGLIPTPDWVINLSIVDESTRELEVQACSPTGLALLQELEAVYP
jgi:tRNA threonylcarbamoyladenosine biosynthesis protein TsaE